MQSRREVFYTFRYTHTSNMMARSYSEQKDWCSSNSSASRTNNSTLSEFHSDSITNNGPKNSFTYQSTPAKSQQSDLHKRKMGVPKTENNYTCSVNHMNGWNLKTSDLHVKVGNFTYQRILAPSNNSGHHFEEPVPKKPRKSSISGIEMVNEKPSNISAGSFLQPANRPMQGQSFNNLKSNFVEQPNRNQDFERYVGKDNYEGYLLNSFGLKNGYKSEHSSTFVNKCYPLQQNKGQILVTAAPMQMKTSRKKDINGKLSHKIIKNKINKNSKEVTSLKCKKRDNNNPLFQPHVIIKVLDVKRYCPLCPFKCHYPGIVQKHIITSHSNENLPPNKCPWCDFFSATNTRLIEHMASCHKNDSTLCKHCVFISGSIGLLKCAYHKNMLQEKLKFLKCQQPLSNGTFFSTPPSFMTQANNGLNY